MPDKKDEEKEGPSEEWKTTRDALVVSTIVEYVGISAYSCCACNAPLCGLGIGILTSGAAWLGGGLFGFLFGIPRSLQKDASGDGKNQNVQGQAKDGQGTRYGVNTNLEQISDWLTKIIVGLGLTNFTLITQKMMKLASLVADGLGNPLGGKIFALSLLTYSMISGFSFCYLWTRLFLPGVLARTERDALKATLDDQGAKLKEIELQKERNTSVLVLAKRQLNLLSKPSDISQEELNEAFKVASSDTKIEIFGLAQDIRHVNLTGPKRLAAMEQTIPIFRALIAADTGNEFHRNHAELGFALKDKGNPQDWPEAEDQLTQAIQIRGSAQDKGWEIYEFNRAICRIRLDPGFKEKRPSDNVHRPTVLEDLRVASRRRPWNVVIKNDEEVLPWLVLNDIDPATLEPR